MPRWDGHPQHTASLPAAHPQLPPGRSGQESCSWGTARHQLQPCLQAGQENKDQGPPRPGCNSHGLGMGGGKGLAGLAGLASTPAPLVPWPHLLKMTIVSFFQLGVDHKNFLELLNILTQNLSDVYIPRAGSERLTAVLPSTWSGSGAKVQSQGDQASHS